MDNHIFRSAALGFNRQDVMEYIEKVQREAEARINGLTAQLDEARPGGFALLPGDRKSTRLNSSHR